MGIVRALCFGILGLAACGKVLADTGDHTVTVTKSGDGDGVVSSDAGLECGAMCSVAVTYQSSITLSAMPDATFAFDGWSGACSGTDVCTLVVTDDVTIDADFGRPLLTIVPDGTGSGTVTSTPTGISCGEQCTAEFDVGTSVTLTAVADPDSQFSGWSGGDCSGTGPCTTTLDQATTVTATFACGGMHELDFTGATQTFTAPACATGLTIDAFGAQGGTPAVTRNLSTAGALGAEIVGTFAMPGVLTVLVGGAGSSSGSGNSGGGGGTYVYATATDATPLIAAGGGGGVCNNSNCVPAPGSDTTTPNASTVGSGNAAGGTNGNGGTGGSTTVTHAGAGGGAGWLSDGLVGGTGGFPGGLGGHAPRNGGAGGASVSPGSLGGFGGGGGGAGSSGACGGGGGYNGGGGGNGWDGTNWGCGGGGGSYNGGTTQTNTAGAHAGNGKVIITWF